MKGLTIVQIDELLNERMDDMKRCAQIAYQRGDIEEYNIDCSKHTELFDLKIRLTCLCANEGKEVKE